MKAPTVALTIPRAQFQRRVNIAADTVTVRVPVTELPDWKGQLVDQLRVFLTEENTDRVLAWIRDRVDLPGPDAVIFGFLDALLPGALLSALDAVATGADQDEDLGDADIPDDELDALRAAFDAPL